MNFDAPNPTNHAEPLCGICGENHNYSECSVVEIKKHIRDNVIPTKARLSLPENLAIQPMADGTHCIVANAFIEKGTQFGPLEAQRLLTLNPSIIFPLKVFNCDVEDLSEYYLDTCDENHCNWMIFVAPAQEVEEQNLICFQEKTNIYYLAMTDIRAGEFLRVWYSPYYAKKMNKDVLVTGDPCEYYDNAVAAPFDLKEVLKKQQNVLERDSWICKFCGKLERDVSLFAIHILEHYNEKFPKKCCTICKQTFSHQKQLRRHIKSVHDKEAASNSKKVKMKVVMPDNVKGKDLLVGAGGPLLNDLLNDSLDNTNLVLPSMELGNFGMALGENQNMLLEADSLNLNVDHLLTENVKELDHFNFEIGESQEQYVCDVCLRGFTKLPYLMQHLRKHTGKYACRKCFKVFCRSENLSGHNCKKDRSITSPKFTCTLCGKGFMLRKYLIRHTTAVHDKKHGCSDCSKTFHSRREFTEHNCPAVPNENKPTFSCPTCSKTFFRDIYLKRHMQTHVNKEKLPPPAKQFICEACAQEFSSRKGLLAHRKTHEERDLSCEVCSKKFHRRDVLNVHMEKHRDVQVTCSVCDVKLKSRQNLAIHMLQHTGVRPHKCSECSEAFHQRSHLVKHRNRVHKKVCGLCRGSFGTKELLDAHTKKEHPTKDYFECPVCKKLMKLKSSLGRHLKQSHGGLDPNSLISPVKPKDFDFAGQDENNLDNLFGDDLDITEALNNNNNGLSTHDNYMGADMGTNLNLKDGVPETDHDSFESIVDNFENIMNSYGSGSDTPNLLPVNYDNMVEAGTNQERILDFNDLQIDLDSNFGLQPTMNTPNREVCLSMPDLMEADQEITFGENAFILEDGTIVEPKDQGNVFVYVLGKKYLSDGSNINV